MFLGCYILHGVTETSHYNFLLLDTAEDSTQQIVKSKYLPKLFAGKTHKMPFYGARMDAIRE